MCFLFNPAIPIGSMGYWAPKVTKPPVRFAHFRSRLFEMQINEEQIGVRHVRIYSRKKTLCSVSHFSLITTSYVSCGRGQKVETVFPLRFLLRIVELNQCAY